MSKKEYEGNNDVPVKEYMYGYDHESGFHDRLKEVILRDREGAESDYSYPYYSKSFYCDDYGQYSTYAGKQINFDTLGRMTSFDHTTFTYNIDGIRLSKTNGDKTTKFFVDGKRILRSVDKDTQIWYYYDTRGVVGMSVTGKGAGDYIFHRNALGDITHIYKRSTDTSYELVARYEYDAWGNHKVYNADGTENTDPEFIGNINPFRYRGYYYDVETKLYYLNARYYDPELCRFISADETQYLDPNSVNGLNLYAYCGNNPVMFVDPEGHAKWWQWLIGALVVVAVTVVTAGAAAVVAAAAGASVAAVAIGAAVGAAVAGTTSLIVQGTTGDCEIDFGRLVIDTFIGGVSGAIGGAFGPAGTAKAFFSQIMFNTLLSSGEYLVSSWLNGDTPTLAGLFVAAAGGALNGMFAGCKIVPSVIVSFATSIASNWEDIWAAIQNKNKKKV